jgi:hypothetical protein
VVFRLVKKELIQSIKEVIIYLDKLIILSERKGETRIKFMNFTEEWKYEELLRIRCFLWQLLNSTISTYFEELKKELLEPINEEPKIITE